MKKVTQNFVEVIRGWASELGFQQLGVTDIDLSAYEKRFHDWLAKGFHGSMDYMAKHGLKRSRPAELIPNTVRILSVRMDYLPANTNCIATLKDTKKAYISRYALGKDYHKLMRKRLTQLAQKINSAVGDFGYRAFCDSAPVLEKPLAEKAGLGFIGKNTNVINPKAGSWFFLGEIYTDLPLPIDSPTAKSHCGSCTACLDVCPTQAIIAPYLLDARKCISYLTIELRDAMPIKLRPLIGNRIYGCDDCQLVCPWNKFAKYTQETNFMPLNNLQSADLLELFKWTKTEFLQKTLGSAIRRIGFDCWQRNIAVALGNAAYDEKIINLLKQKREQVSPLVREHIDWALSRQRFCS